MKTSSEGSVRPSLVILLTYGPRPVTRAALRSLKNQLPGVDIHQVAAFGGTAIAQLESLLRGAGQQPVLVIHDDVAIQRRSIERLTTVALRGTSVAIPASNDEDCSHYFGALPAGQQAKAALTRAESDAISQVDPAETFRPTCMVGRGEELYKLISQRLHDPLSVMSNSGDGVVVVRDAIAAHDHTCVTQLRNFASPRDEVLLVASMIVKNEEAMLGDCLESLDGVVDRIHVCDTGSEDQTVAIAEAAGATVIHREWRDDFAWARNEALNECRDARWILWIDADERVRVPDISLLRAYLAAFDGELEAFSVEISNLSAADSDTATSRFSTVRLFRADRACFVGALHEQVRHLSEAQRDLESMRLSLMGIDHLGYMNEILEGRGKQDRNVDISRDEYLKTGEAKAAMDYARSLNLAGEQPELVLELLEESLEGLLEEEVSARAYVLSFLARVLLFDHDQPLEAIDRALDALELVPTEDLALGVLGQAHVQTGQYSDLIEFHDAHSFAEIPRPVTVIDSARGQYHRCLALSYLDSGDIETAWQNILEMTSLTSEYQRDDLTAIVDVARERDLCESLVSVGMEFENLDDVDELVLVVAAGTTPALTAAVCAELLVAGIESPGAVSTGLLAAVMTDHIDLAQELTRFGGLLEPLVAQKLISRLHQRGYSELALSLEPSYTSA